MTGTPLRRLAAAAALAWACGLAGCAYWNGMYNTKKFAGRAERSERAGRMSEAADRWRQVVQHADTLLSRHPRSRWADDAELLKGRALVALAAWPEAVEALESARLRVGTEEQLRQAQYWLGVANAGRRAYRQALANFDSALASRERDLRQAVRLARGRTLLVMGRPAEALRDFEAVALPAAQFERARTALALGLPRLAAAYADTAAGVEDVPMEGWPQFLDSLGRQGGAAAASGVVDRLLRRGDLSSGARARLLLADGNRWEAEGADSMALTRWGAAARAAPDSAEARAAETRALRHALRGPAAAQRLPVITQRLGEIAGAGGQPAEEAREVLRLLAVVELATHPEAPSDAGAFLGAEWLRDSLGAHLLAAERFAALAEGFPESPWAPKSLAAAIAAGHPAADSLLVVLRDRYGDSPYAQGAMGLASDPFLYAALEDSLSRALEANALAPTVREDDAGVQLDDEAEEALRARRIRESTGRAAVAATPLRAPAPPPVAPPRPPALPRDPQP